MAVPHITSFCWCLGLEAGSKSIGLLHLMTSFSLMVMCAVFAEEFRAMAGTAEDAGDHLYSTWYAISASAAVFSALHAVLASGLLYAAYTRKSRWLRVWVWVMLLLCSASLLLIAASTAPGFSSSGSDIFVALLLGVLFFGFVLYCILCVNSYRLLLKSAEDMQEPPATY